MCCHHDSLPQERIYSLQQQARAAEEMLQANLAEKELQSKRELTEMASKQRELDASYQERLRQVSAATGWSDTEILNVTLSSMVLPISNEHAPQLFLTHACS